MKLVRFNGGRIGLLRDSEVIDAIDLVGFDPQAWPPTGMVHPGVSDRRGRPSQLTHRRLRDEHGMQDSVDLRWKLAAMVQGWGGEHLLASYEPERRPVALRNVVEAGANLSRMLSPRNKLSSLVFEASPASEQAGARSVTPTRRR